MELEEREREMPRNGVPDIDTVLPLIDDLDKDWRTWSELSKRDLGGRALEMGRAGWANARLLALSDKERKRRRMVVMVRVSGVDIGAGSEREDVWGIYVSIYQSNCNIF